MAYSKHLQSVLLAYKSVRALAKFTMLRYFWEGLKPSILAKLQNKNLELESVLQIVKKIVIAKAKANL